MSEQEYYTINQLKIMNSTTNWRHHIILPDNKNSNILYKIYATGDADLNGRYYIALNKNINVKNRRIIEMYNLF